MAQLIKRPQVLWAALALTVVVTLLLVACGSGSAGAASRQSASTQVVRVNGSDASHTVTSSGGFASSGLIGQRQSFSATFANAGTFAYHCTVHPYMMGTVIVK